MRSDDYRHLRDAFTEMAIQQSNSPDVRARWLTVAQTCFDLEQNRPPIGVARTKKTHRVVRVAASFSAPKVQKTSASLVPTAFASR